MSKYVPAIVGTGAQDSPFARLSGCRGGDDISSRISIDHLRGITEQSGIYLSL